MSGPSSFGRAAWKTAASHVFFCGAALAFPVILVRNIVAFDRPEIWSDGFAHLWGAEQFVVEKTFPLAGNGAFWPYRLGPLAYLLTALPQFVKPGILSSYVLVWSLYLLSIPLFYFAVWRFWGNKAAAFAAAFWFAITPNIKEPLVELTENDSYLPVLLALYALLLLRRPQKSALLWLYLVIGLAMQSHLTAVCLIPSTVIFLWQDRRHLLSQMPWHGIGLIVVALLHVTVLVDAASLDPAAFWGTSRSVLANLRTFDWSLFFSTIRSAGATCLPAIIAAPAFFLSKATLNAATKKLLVKLGLILAVQVFAAAFFTALKAAAEIPECYFAIDTPFLGLTLASAVNESMRGRRENHGRFAFLFPLAALCLVSVSFAARNSAAMQPLDEPDKAVSLHRANAAAMHRWLVEEKMPGVSQLVGHWFLFGRDNEIFPIWPVSDGKMYKTNGIYKTLFCLERPQDCPVAGGETVYQLTLEFCDARQLAEFVRAPERVLARPEQCVGPVRVAELLISYFCRGPGDPTQPEARVVQIRPAFPSGAPAQCAAPPTSVKR